MRSVVVMASAVKTATRSNVYVTPVAVDSIVKL